MSSHHHLNVAPGDPGLKLGGAGSMLANAGLLIGVLGLVATALVGMISGWERAQMSYLFAFMVVTTICLGGLFFVLIHHATRAGWSTSIRRVAENIAGNLMVVIPVLFIPVAIFMALGAFSDHHAAADGTHHTHWLYSHWTDSRLTDPGSSHYDAIVDHKSGYLNAQFWLVRAVLFLAIWSFFARFLWKNSVDQDATGDVAYTHRMQGLAPAGCVLFALTLTFAAVDWVMSLESHWFSTMFGVYFFAASCTGFFATLIITTYLLQRAGKLRDVVTLEHYQDMGKLLFAFGVVFWAYIAFSQYMLIWYANLPEETTWYWARQLGGWMPVTVFLLIGHFVLPFLILVTKHTKRIPFVLSLIAGGMLFMHCVDMYWQVLPQIPHSFLHDANSVEELRAMVAADIEAEHGKYRYFAPSPLDLTALLGMGGLLVFCTIRRMSKAALIPVNDPRLNEALAFENM